MQFTSDAEYKRLNLLNQGSHEVRKNNSATYDSKKVIDFIQNNPEECQEILAHTLDGVDFPD